MEPNFQKTYMLGTRHLSNKEAETWHEDIHFYAHNLVKWGGDKQNPQGTVVAEAQARSDEPESHMCNHAPH